MKILYTTDATSTGGRDGRSVTGDGALAVKLTRPKELGGAGGDGTNPEQLFAAGYSACFLSALNFVASQARIKLPEDASVTARVGIGPRDDGKGFALDVRLTVAIPGVERATVEDLVGKAHVVCPYSHATRGNVDVQINVA